MAEIAAQPAASRKNEKEGVIAKLHKELVAQARFQIVAEILRQITRHLGFGHQHQQPVLLALLIEKQARKKFGDTWVRLDQARSVSWWRLWKMVRREFAEWIVGATYWKQENYAACLQVMQERPRRRKLQTLCDPIKHLLQGCRELGIC